MICLLIAAGVAWLFIASQQVPEFYLHAAEIPAEKAAQHGERLERAVLQLQNEVRRDDHFQMTFTADEINGWLANDLLKKFPKLLPPEIHEPRVALEPGKILIGFRYEPGVKTVVTVVLEPILDAESNQLAIRVRQMQAGSLSVPLGALIEQFVKRAQTAKIPIRWEQDDGVPTAVIPLQFLSDAYRDKHVVVETLQVTAGEITIAGHTVAIPAKPTQSK
jgi:hypothetical protein